MVCVIFLFKRPTDSFNIAIIKIADVDIRTIIQKNHNTIRSTNLDSFDRPVKANDLNFVS